MNKIANQRRRVMRKMPEYWKKEGLELAQEMTLFGVPMAQLSSEEILAGCAQAWKMYNDQVQSSVRTMQTLADLKSRRYR